MIARKVVCRMTKREARAWAKARRAELDMAAVGRGMAQALFSLPQWQSAGAVLAFAAMPDEPDTAEILRRALADGKRLLLPRVRSKTEMDWVEIPALRLLRPGAFGIQEPPADLPAADPAGYAAALALVPCLAASRDGVRLGRGGGYYDRFLAHYKGAGLLLCPEALLLDELPGVDMDKVLRMCLIHDFGEAVTGDIPSFEKTGADEAAETEAVAGMLAPLPEPLRGELTALFAEMDACETPESRVYKALDKLEAVLQHNEAPLDTWTPLERQLQLDYGAENAAEFPWLRALRDALRQDTLEKLGK